MSHPAELLEDPAIARVVLAALERDAVAQLRADQDRRRNGLTPRAALPPVELLDALAAIAGVDVASDLTMSASGPGPASLSSSTRWVTATQAADLSGYTARHTRRLARSGQVIARKVGTTWLIDPESMESVQRRKSA